MTTEVPTYKHDMGNGLYLEAFSLDPKIGTAELEEMVVKRDGKADFDLQRLGKRVSWAGRVDSLGDLRFRGVNKQYQVPEVLQAYRQAREPVLDAQGKENRDVCILDGKLSGEINLFRGGYYDYMATKVEEIPANLGAELGWASEILEPFQKLKGLNTANTGSSTLNSVLEQIEKYANGHTSITEQYVPGESVGDLIEQGVMTNDQRARYLCFTFMLMPSNGKEFGFVQRAKGMGIASDCMSPSGSTPQFDERFFDPGFDDFQRFYADEVQREMNEEFRLEGNEHNIDEIYLFDDKPSIPSMTAVIKTPLSTREIAERCYGNEEVIKEHPLLFAIEANPKAVVSLVDNMLLHDATAYMGHKIVSK